MTDTPQNYPALVRMLRNGGKLKPAILRQVLQEAGETAENTFFAVFSDSAVPEPQPGDPCEECDGRLKVYKTVPCGDRQVRYLKCGQCGHLPARNKQTVPAGNIRRRKRKT